MDILRQRSREAELPTELTAPAAESWEFLELISPLSKSEQELVSFRFIGGFSHEEIARITGTTVHAAKKRYERAIQKLRTEMEVTL
jgi:RNA polymerase sigma factor (sigma-70 family)